MTKRNLTSAEIDYNKAISDLKSRVPNDLLASAPNLLTNRVSVQSLISRYELYKMIMNVPGDIVECGVYQGNSLLWLAHLSVILEPYSVNRHIIGFDTFEGFRSIDRSIDPEDISERTFSDTSFELINDSLKALDIVRPVNGINRFKIIKGDIVDTVPSFVKANPAFTCAMLILDTDLYTPTLTALETVIPHMPKGALVVLDEYNYENFRGETKALKDYSSIGNFRIKRFSYDSCLAYFEI